MVTPLNRTYTRAQLQNLQCQGVLLKPIRLQALYQTLLVLFSPQSVKTPSVPVVSEPSRASESKAILLVEDNPINTKVVVNLLTKAGYHVDTAENGVQALEAIRCKTYDLILMDVQMPVMDGFETTLHIREIEGNARHTPIIAMTAHAFREDVQRCLACGMDDYLAKPLKPQQLYETITHWLSSRRANTAIETPKSASLPPPLERSLPNTTHLAATPSPQDETPSTSRRVPLGHARYLETILPRFGHEPAFFIEMFEAFIEQTAQKVKELRQAAQKNDAAAIKFLAHNLKGVAANFEAASLVTYCTQLEQMARQNRLQGAPALIEAIADTLPELRRHLIAIKTTLQVSPPKLEG
ncbi:MAG: response regulator [Thermanaerothrix sp.]|nr:response regulator [Thermanaerothrix sp.]